LRARVQAIPGSDEHIDAAVMSTKLDGGAAGDDDEAGKWGEAEAKGAKKATVAKSGKGLGDLTEL
jgi:hypothetical protein